MAVPKAVPALSLELVLKLMDSHCIIREDLKQRFRSEAKPMVAHGVSIVVGVEGGIVQGFSAKATNDPNDLSLIVCDYDCEGSDESEKIRFQDGDRTSEAWAYEHAGDRTDEGEQFVDRVIAAMDERDSRESGEALAEALSDADADGTE